MIIGKPLAITIFKILVIIRMMALSERRRELSQKIASPSGSMRMEIGMPALRLVLEYGG
jgi:hypothetical protein